mgnify:CR=1 FL=1
MYLRKLRIKDAPFMLEWMHDKSVVENLQTDFARKTLADCEQFICNSQNDYSNLHIAIVDDNDEYMGTVSLKNLWDETAEFAIAIRKNAMGTGIASKAMEDIINIGFEEKGLSSIYWCVSPENKRAVRFYDKNGYHRVCPDALKIFFWGGVQRVADSRVLLVPHHKRGKEEQNLRIKNRNKKVNTDILFLQSVA